MTSTLLYLSIKVHSSNRLEQRDAIHEQVRLLRNLASPIGAYDRRLAPKNPLPTDDTAPQPSQPSMEDRLKHHWNKEVEKLAKKAYASRWQDARDAAVEGWKAAKRLVKGD